MNNPESIYDFYKLKPWVNPRQITWWKMVANKNNMPFLEKHINSLNHECLKNLCKNPFAAEMLERHLDKISWNDFVNNPNAIHIIEKHFDVCFKSLNWRGRIDLIRHPNFVHLIEKHEDEILDKLLTNDCLAILAEHKNPKYVDLFEKFMKKYPERVHNDLYYFWNDLCENPIAIHVIEQYLDKLPNCSWQILAGNPNAIPIVEKNLHKLDDKGWRNLSENPNAIPILEQNMDKINWFNLSSNPNGVRILEKYPDKISFYSFIDYENFSVNAPIFELDYDAIQNRCNIYKDELMQVALHPSRIAKYLAQGIPVDKLDQVI